MKTATTTRTGPLTCVERPISEDLADQLTRAVGRVIEATRRKTLAGQRYARTEICLTELSEAHAAAEGAVRDLWDLLYRHTQFQTPEAVVEAHLAVEGRAEG